MSNTGQSTKKARRFYAVKVPGLPGNHKLRAEDETQALRLFRLMFPNARDPRVTPISEADAFGDVAP